jgi:hypothetical protein
LFLIKLEATPISGNEIGTSSTAFENARRARTVEIAHANAAHPFSNISLAAAKALAEPNRFQETPALYELKDVKDSIINFDFEQRFLQLGLTGLSLHNKQFALNPISQEFRFRENECSLFIVIRPSSPPRTLSRQAPRSTHRKSNANSPRGIRRTGE